MENSISIEFNKQMFEIDQQLSKSRSKSSLPLFQIQTCKFDLYPPEMVKFTIQLLKNTNLQS